MLCHCDVIFSNVGLYASHCLVICFLLSGYTLPTVRLYASHCRVIRFPLSGYMLPTLMLLRHSCCSVTVILPCPSCCLPASYCSATMILLVAVIALSSALSLNATLLLQYCLPLACHIATVMQLDSIPCCLATHSAAGHSHCCSTPVIMLC